MDVLHLYSRPQKDIRTPESGGKGRRTETSDSPCAGEQPSRSGGPKRGAEQQRVPAGAAASPPSSEPSGSFVPDTYPGASAENAPAAKAANNQNGVPEQEAEAAPEQNGEGLQDDGAGCAQPQKRQRLSLESDREGRDARELKAGAKKSAEKAPHLQGVLAARHAGAAGATPVTRAVARELGSDAAPRATRRQPHAERQARKGALVRAGGLRRAGQVRPAPGPAPGRRLSRPLSAAGGRQPAAPPTLHRKRSPPEPPSDTRGPRKQRRHGGDPGPAAGDDLTSEEGRQTDGGEAEGEGQDGVLESRCRRTAGAPLQAAAAQQEPQQPGRAGGLREGRARDPYRCSRCLRLLLSLNPTLMLRRRNTSWTF